MDASQQSLTNNALKRLKALADGNGMAPEAIELIEYEEKTHILTGYIQLTPRFSIRTLDKQGRIRAKGGRLLSSFDALNQEVAKMQAESENSDSWIGEATKAIKKTPGHGWGHQDSHLSWTEQDQILTATENCPACRGAAQHPCPHCQGIGSLQCHYCQGLGQEFCLHCNGTGYDPANPQTPCTYCRGTRHQICRFCHGNKRLPCERCAAKGNTPCEKCKGTGFLSREVRLRSGADISFRFNKTDALPSGLLRVLSRLGEDKIHQGHADIEIAEPKDDATKEEKKRILLTAKIPYADIKLRIGGKGFLVACFGKKGLLSGVPPFLDQALTPARKTLSKAVHGLEPLEKALSNRLMKDALKLSLSGHSHPNTLRKRYPIGLTEKTAAEILKNMGLALKRETMKVRTIVATLCALFSVGLFSAVFLSDFYVWAHNHYRAGAMIVAEGLLPLLALGLTWYSLHTFAQLILKSRFPGIAVKTSPNIGVRGYTAMAIILFSYIALLSYAKITFPDA